MCNLSFLTVVVWCHFGYTCKKGTEKGVFVMGIKRIYEKIGQTQINTAIIVAGIVIAAALRQLSRLSYVQSVDDAVTLLRPTIYILIFGSWGISVRKRIVNNRIRQLLTAIASLMIFWVCVRTIKYTAESYEVIRYTWYLYYVPQLFIPTLFFVVSYSLGKREESRKRGAIVAFAVSAVLVLLVLTNDLHQTVFRFDGRPFTEHNYSHQPVFYLVWGWMVLLALASTVLILVKCRVNEKKKFVILPLVAISVAFLYAVLTAAGNPVVKVIAGDMTVSFCVLYMFIIESCLRSGLIRISTGYEELFRRSTIRAQILDDDYKTFLSSGDAVTYPIQTIRETEWGPVLLEDGIRLSNFKIRGGHFLWQEDTTELFNVMQELDEAKKDLEARNAVLAEAYNAERNLHRLEAQNNLYDSIQKKTRKQINMLSRLLRDYRNAETPGERTEILRRIIVLGVYIKRRNNLIFISEQSDKIPVRELELCFEETVNDLELAGIRSSCFISAGDEIPTKIATEIYDFYEKICEEVYGGTESLLIRIYKEKGCFVLSIDLKCNELKLMGMSDAEVSEEDGIIEITRRFREVAE